MLLGYVKNRSHLDWIHEHNLYNLRASGKRGRVGLRGRELSAELVLLYGRESIPVELWRVVDEPELRSRNQMQRLGYPDAGHEIYFCLPIERIADWQPPANFTMAKFESLRREAAPDLVVGAPAVTT